MKISIEQLRQIMPLLPIDKAAAYLPMLQAAMDEFEITTPVRAAAFLAQIAHESVQLKNFEEIASGAAYEGRRDLGNVEKGDGQRYKGRGPIQITGRSNYALYGKLLGFDLINNPEQAAHPAIGFLIAGLYWKRRGLNQLADARRFTAITRLINGGLNGLDDRLRYYRRALACFGLSAETAS